MGPIENRESRKRWTVLVEGQPQKVFRRLPRDLLQRIRLAIRGLAEEPKPPGCKKLQGYDNLYRIRVGDWWISYAVEDDQLIVLVIEVAPRSDAVDYRGLKERILAVLELSESKELATNSLKKLATRTEVEMVVLPGGVELQVGKWLIPFPPADPDRLPAGTLAQTYAAKPLVDVEGESLFGELAIVRWLQKDGWDAVWVDAFHDKGRHKLFWQGMPDRTSPYDLSQAPQAWDLYQRIIECNGGGAGGSFDVFAWKGAERLFIEYKGPGDRRNANELSWLEAAIEAGVHECDLLYVVHP